MTIGLVVLSVYVVFRLIDCCKTQAGCGPLIGEIHVSLYTPGNSHRETVSEVVGVHSSVPLE